ncbi:similar to Saccharomyces cerevisiae YOL063C CRT10 Protein involved in transcriptional regulation of RNR2 and RNR3 [Maudiozyma barnettii]|uniref:Similar to Saccharomyces cerevisiae YOL063C CRT10 Protein involved in transcriptional regulation of RNR2 and RNR3 n=1 Tax=Maudiozyma barnettii TaxID=61262 RepID=A0A8H2ZIQ7_9SACH|nr:Crt10p [Kazachstania barnettii]CAB4257199.1 similar to Saccharomyces cerevisiae YOL063C CRT10 Protein involved in transcriptional regulation of RNR2 and RNR3 [Kazachstania barnettii]CAD1779569.1 similar to Saccharomyces cerevisiae YOL063C CRT10 Protein involved in transcriptional regulation of RNR2 and RNR3 [Kazachstania barnettii]
MNSDTVQERFANWLLVHRIAYKVSITDSLPYDADMYTEINDLNNVGVYQKKKIRHYYLDKRFPDPTCFLPSAAFYRIKAFYNDLETFSINKDLTVTTDHGEPLLEYIRTEGMGDFEPVWSDTRIQDPATMFLPNNQKLVVEKVERHNIPYRLSDSRTPLLNFNNNLLCTYGEWVIVVVGSKILRFKMDDDIDGDVTETNKSFDLFDLLSLDLPSGISVGDFIEHDIFTKTDLLRVNFMKVCKFQSLDVLCFCTEVGIVIIIDLPHWILHSSDLLVTCGYKVCEDATPYSKYAALPIAILDVTHGAWSLDIIQLSSEVSIVAIGHNGPGISIFRFEGAYVESSGTLSTPHNVPCLNFIQDSLDLQGYVTLTYVTVKGSISVIKVRFTQEKLDVIHLDTQLVDEMVWTVTPLRRSDFLPVPTFELLNLNFKEFFKQSILSSVIMDTMVLNGELPNPSISNRLGPGTLTTQIPVPTSNLTWRCIGGMPDTHVNLRFTTFDIYGQIDSATLIKGDHEGFDWLVLNERTELRSKERVELDERINPINHYYLGNTSKESCNCFSGTDTQRYEKLWNGGFLIKPCSRPKSSSSTALSLRSETPINNTNFKFAYFPFQAEEDDLESYYPQRKFKDMTYEWKVRRQNSRHEWSVFHRLDDPTVKKPAEPAMAQKTLSPFSLGMEPLSRKGFDNDGALASKERSVSISNEYMDAAPFRTTISAGTTDSHFDNNEDNGLNRRLEYAHEQQGQWFLHNHVSKVRKLMKYMNLKKEDLVTQENNEKKVIDSIDDNDILLVTTESRILLMKLFPLIITSFTMDEIFPLEDVTVCIPHSFMDSINRINFVCFIKELNCIVAASQLGLVSLLRLTEYKGILSFRQEYILGWQSQDPQRPIDDRDECIKDTMKGRHGDGITCGVDDVAFRLFNIIGMDYTYKPYDRRNKTGGYAILFLNSHGELHRYKISPGDSRYHV